VIGLYGRCCFAALKAQQREASAQAQRWVTREIIAALAAQPLTVEQMRERYPKPVGHRWQTIGNRTEVWPVFDYPSRTR
jgi:hypothetical protein